MAPDEQSLRADLASARFLSGEDRNRWQFKKLEWPFIYINVIARDKREYPLRLNCCGFPTTPPTGTFWDLSTNSKLSFDRWPQGGERLQTGLQAQLEDRGGALHPLRPRKHRRSRLLVRPVPAAHLEARQGHQPLPGGGP